jgi:hypothetical protein
METAAKRLPKGRRSPEAVSGKGITERGIRIIETIARYRFLPSRDVARLVGGNEDVTYRHLQRLYHQSLISRFTLPVPSRRGEFIYFLDNAAGLRQLAETSALDGSLLQWDVIRQNREKYSESEKRSVGRFLFVEHELMISAFHANLELAVQNDPTVELERWVQGPSLWSSVKASSGQVLPHRPDALFVLRFPNAPEGQQRSNFLYEADRGTCNLNRIRQKLESYLLFFLEGRHVEHYHMRKVRAVLIETISERRVEELRSIAASLSAMTPLAGALFWVSAKSGDVGAPHITETQWMCGMDNRPRTLCD